MKQHILHNVKKYRCSTVTRNKQQNYYNW